MPRVNAVLFGFEGLFGAGKDTPSLNIALAEHFGIKDSQSDKDELIKLHQQLLLGALGTKAFIDQANNQYANKATSLTSARYVKLGGDGSQLAHPLRTLASVLRDSKIKTGIVSNMRRTTADRISKAGGFDDMDHLFLSHRVGLLKPSRILEASEVNESDQAIYFHALDTMGLDPDNVVYVDSPYNLIPARGKLHIEPNPDPNARISTLHGYSPDQVATAMDAILRARNNVNLSIGGKNADRARS